MGVSSFVVLTWTGWRGVPPTWPALSDDTRSVADGVVAGLFAAGAVAATLVSWRGNARVRPGWTVATGAVIAVQALLITLPAIASPPPWNTFVFATLLAIGLAGTWCVVGALAGRRQARQGLDECFGIGLGMGLIAAGTLLLHLPLASPRTVHIQVLIGVLAGTQLAATALVLSQRALPASTARLLVTTVLVVVSGATAPAVGLGGTGWNAALSLALAGAGVAWLATAWASLQRGAQRSADGRRAEIDYALVATARAYRERMHEMRSTLAGLVNGATLLDSTEITPEARQHLWESVRRELDRMQRLLAGEHTTVTDIDLDEELQMILDLQRLKGRHVELRTSGDSVRARYDSLAGVVNILMDNAATHGGSDNSLVEVVRRDDETVDITVSDFGRGIPEEDRDRIFDWGGRGPDSPGEGIGLHMAQRLMTEDGGTLRLARAQGAGSTFVISLPAVRRSPENHCSEEDGHVAWRRSG